MVRDKIKGIINWQPWHHLLMLLDAFQQYHRIIILKPKQVGVTWLVQASNLHLAMFQEGANILTLSVGESEAGEELDYCRFMHSRLPETLKLKVGADQYSLITFPACHSKMRALPSTAHSGVGYGGATRVVLDEFEYHEYAEENFSEIMPMVEDGGQVIIMSTVDKLKQDTKFKEVYRKARLGENNFYPIFLPYNVLPERTEKWYEERKRDYEDWEMEGKYPRNEEEALSAAVTVCRFNMDALKGMLTECCSPLREERGGLVKIYREPVAGRRYVFAIDPSEGEYEPSAGVIVDAETYEEIVSYSDKIHLDEHAQLAFELYQKYNNALLAPERNASGLTLITKLKDLGVKNWAYFDVKREKPGWYTSGASGGKGSRPVMITGLANLVYLRRLRIYNKKALDQFVNFIRTVKHPDGIKTRGTHDDFVLAWAIACQAVKELPRSGDIHFKTWTREARTY